jgi:hypothetical protein
MVLTFENPLDSGYEGRLASRACSTFFNFVMKNLVNLDIFCHSGHKNGCKQLNLTQNFMLSPNMLRDERLFAVQVLQTGFTV